MVLDEAIILVGGLGTRLRGVVAQEPKPIAPVAGRPFLAWLLDRLERSGVTRAILAVGYRADRIGAAIGTRHGAMTVDYVEEDEPLGTGGALRRALREVRGRSALALNGDTLFLIDLRQMADAALSFPERLIVALRPADAADRYGTCLVEGDRITAFSAQSTQGRTLINGGVYVTPRRLFDRFDLPDKFSFEADFIERHIEALAPLAVISDDPFIDIGVPESYAAAQQLVPKWLSA
jgi:D-glycero-alpha-D-manno-heptose 1-phosphate guanylyltransferase